MRFAFSVSLAACLVLLVSAAEEASSGQESKVQSKSDSDSKKGGKENGKVDEKTKGDAIRVSQLFGMPVRKSKAKDSKELGDIQDLMLDIRDQGRVRYAALSFGGFLGIGNKLFAIPWSAFKIEHDADRDKNYVVFDVTEQTLEKTRGFDKDHWPNMADRRWMQAADQQYDVKVYVGGADVLVRIEEREQSSAGAHLADPYAQLHRGSELIGMQVKNFVGDKLGEVEDIVVAMDSGEIRYLALSFGGFLGIGDKFFAVPCEAVSVQYGAEGDESFLLFDVTKDQLDQADGFDKDQWPDSGNDDWTLASHEEFKAKSSDKKSGGKESGGKESQ
ncbi:MAG TPA: PRC-barrel domain-containing protein [Pirellulales bacterium]|nr:PRC-barrel domain-containing protein [Pirellulales bacterium]